MRMKFSLYRFNLKTTLKEKSILFDKEFLVNQRFTYSTILYNFAEFILKIVVLRNNHAKTLLAKAYSP